jgi:ubiquitin-protein ligase
MQPDSMEFKTTMFLPNSTIATGQLCPDQRRMPQIVSDLTFRLFFAWCN